MVGLKILKHAGVVLVGFSEAAKGGGCRTRDNHILMPRLHYELFSFCFCFHTHYYGEIIYIYIKIIYVCVVHACAAAHIYYLCI